MQKKINLLLAEDHRLVSDGLKSLIATEPDLHVVATIENPEKVISFCHAHSELDVILMDIRFEHYPHLNGLELTKQINQIKAEFPKIKVKVLVCSVNEDAAYIQRAKEVGASGYVFKNDSPEYIFCGIREVAKGGEFWPLIIDDFDLDPLPKPTPTEMEVLKYLAIGMQSDQIGIELAMLEATVSTHRRNIRQKYRINTPGKLTLFAKKCMDIYGTPPDQKLSEELTKLTDEFKKQIKERIKEQTSMAVESADEITVEIKFPDRIGEFNNATNRALSRTVEEAFRNIRQHASARKVSIHLTELNASWITLTICTEGKGFDVAHISSGSSGGIGALERILAAIGGELAINSSPVSSAMITATLRRTAQR
ncbi:response regulator [Nitrosospira sp. Nsp1]|uniref:response regulator n=1 Tax=Nitrosospira sp. Nsp1 TaxID=136547 RepID=UPI0008808490|nr:response regulator [Nitrosospira sp. Nsp1]SCX46190.1 DNA-binding response regulator, NarL/FixJ family, contains REC and HTH domains [Nitrosospira sp. Nsp1]